MSEVMHQYLITFTPVDTFLFSGESSVQTKKSTVNEAFFVGDAYHDRRQSFVVTTEKTPPQTTVMGAIRYFLLQDKGLLGKTKSDVEKAIGKSSFNPANPTTEMGVIRKISAVCITGEDNETRVLCVPAPCDKTYDTDDYAPMQKKDYDPKKDLKRGYFLYDMKTKDGKLTCENRNAKRWEEQDKFFAVSTRAGFAIPGKKKETKTEEPETETEVPETGDPETDDGNFFMQKRCQLRDRRKDKVETKDKDKAAIDRPAFCVLAELSESLSNVGESRMMRLGSRGSVFVVRAEPCNIDMSVLTVPKTAENRTGDYRLSLTSPARLPKGWNTAYGIQQAFVNTKPVRSAVTGDDMNLRLIEERLTFADTGSVFIFETEGARDAFETKLSGSALTVCGSNQIETEKNPDVSEEMLFALTVCGFNQTMKY